jgi:hypothetical protein
MAVLVLRRPRWGVCVCDLGGRVAPLAAVWKIGTATAYCCNDDGFICVFILFADLHGWVVLA